MGGLLLETEQSATTHRLDHAVSHEALRLSERSGPLCDPGLAFECLAPPPRECDEGGSMHMRWISG